MDLFMFKISFLLWGNLIDEGGRNARLRDAGLNGWGLLFGEARKLTGLFWIQGAVDVSDGSHS